MEPPNRGQVVTKGARASPPGVTLLGVEGLADTYRAPLKKTDARNKFWANFGPHPIK